MQFGGDVVDAVDDHLRFTAQHVGRGFRLVETVDRLDPGAGIDDAGPFGHELHLRASDRRGHRVELPIDVGDADLVEVDEGQPADPGAGKALGCIAADAAHSQDHDVGVRELFRVAPSPQPGVAVEAPGDGHGCAEGPVGREGSDGQEGSDDGDAGDAVRARGFAAREARP